MFVDWCWKCSNAQKLRHFCSFDHKLQIAHLITNYKHRLILSWRSGVETSWLLMRNYLCSSKHWAQIHLFMFTHFVHLHITSNLSTFSCQLHRCSSFASYYNFLKMIVMWSVIWTVAFGTEKRWQNWQPSRISVTVFWI